MLKNNITVEDIIQGYADDLENNTEASPFITFSKDYTRIGCPYGDYHTSCLLITFMQRLQQQKKFRALDKIYQRFNIPEGLSLKQAITIIHLLE